MRPLRVLLLSDGRPGHYHLADGIAAAIARRRPVEIRKLEITRRRAVPSRGLAFLLNRWVPPRLALRIGYGLEPQGIAEADLVLSAGGDTLAANVAMARLYGAHNIFCGTLRHFTPQSFSLVISSYARHASLPNHLIALKPNGLDPDSLGREELTLGGQGPAIRMAGLLIGGDSGLFRYAPDEWQRLLQFIEQTFVEAGIRWIVSTSRRSPDQVGEALLVLSRRSDGPIAEFIDFRTAGAGTLPRLFQRAQAILCTEDSSTMISEAVCARLPVVGVSPRVHAFKDEEREYRAFMRDEGWCAFIKLADLSPQEFAATIGKVTPLRENHLDRLAGQLASRLPELFRD